MADIKWVKIAVDIFDDEKILLIETMPEADSILVIWFKLICLAGKQNNGGVFTVHNGYLRYTDEMFAAVFRRPLNTVRLAMQTFERFGMIEIINDTVTIPNWSKHQSLDSYEKRKERDRAYQQQRREKLKLQLQPPESTDNRPTRRPTKGDALTDESTDESTDVASKIRGDYIYTTPPTPPMGGEGEVVDDNPFSETASSAQPPDFNTVEVYAVNNLRVMKEGPMRELAEFKAELPDEVIRHAIDEACANGKPHWSYTRSILQRYEEEGIMTLGDAKASDAAFHKQKQQSQPQPSQRSSSEPRKDGWI